MRQSLYRWLGNKLHELGDWCFDQCFEVRVKDALKMAKLALDNKFQQQQDVRMH